MRHSIVFFVLIVFFSCSQKKVYEKPDDPLEAGREFIRFALDGEMSKARSFILSDGANERIFENIEKKYEAESKDEKNNYRNASIIINKVQTVNASTTIINFSNSFKKENNELKLVKLNGEWWVDFKYTFTGELSPQQ